MSATADWEILEDKYYRRILLYTGLFDDPDFDLSDYLVSGAPYGGALGLPQLRASLTCWIGAYLEF
jgi:hypothetical protein